MYLSLPNEIWTLIAKHAVSRGILPHSFNPSADNFETVQGFSMTSPLFAAIIDSLSYEKVFLKKCSEILDWEKSCQRVRHLQVLHFCHNDDPSDLFFNSLSHFTHLTSLSLPTKDVLLTLTRLQSFPFAPVLSRLDLRSPFSALPLNNITLCFPRLAELRLGAEILTQSREPSLFDEHHRSVEQLSKELVAFLSNSSDLRLVSIHCALDDTAAFDRQLLIHQGSLAHLEPSEGYERHYADCPLCTESYDHDDVARNENFATRILAESLPHLTTVLWANVWLRTRDEESGQRCIFIDRKITGYVPEILLSRDDGRVLD